MDRGETTDRARRGSEPAVIRGLAGWLIDRPPVVLTEWPRRHFDPEHVSLLSETIPGVRWYVLDVRFRPILPTPERLASLGQANLLAVPPGA